MKVFITALVRLVSATDTMWEVGSMVFETVWDYRQMKKELTTECGRMGYGMGMELCDGMGINRTLKASTVAKPTRVNG